MSLLIEGLRENVPSRLHRAQIYGIVVLQHLKGLPKEIYYNFANPEHEADLRAERLEKLTFHLNAFLLKHDLIDLEQSADEELS